MLSRVAGARPIDLSLYQSPWADFAHLSLRDLLDARDQHHAHLVRHPNVVATAVGRYRIRVEDSWPHDTKQHHGTGVRTLENSQVRPYSWPCILVFVERWQSPKDFARHPGDMVPATIYMADGRKVPVCVVEAPRQGRTDRVARDIVWPVNNLGPGRPIVAEVQGRSYLATVGCLVSDGHKVYALTNRHVTGEAGEVVRARRGTGDARVGVSAAAQLARLPFSTLYPSLPGRETYVNLDIGLVDLDSLADWTPHVPGIGVAGPLADFSDAALSLSLVGCRVRGVGAASGDQRGEIHGLFYRYKSSGGFEYVADLMIGPVAPAPGDAGGRPADPPLRTLPGDSGRLWLLEPVPEGNASGASPDYRPLAVQWGRNMLHSAGAAAPQAYALATLLSRVCALLDVDLVRDWDLDQPDTWGAIGHFSIALKSRVGLSRRHPRLVALMTANADIVSRSQADIEAGDFTGMGSAAFVPLADVPDFFWKPRVAKQGHARPGEGPNHFADMDQPGPGGQTLLDLTTDPAFIDPDRWNAFYDSVRDLLSGQPIAPEHRGLLPFRVWQIVDAMTGFVAAGNAPRFVCAAGVLTHYVGDACQPLHISYLHDGDPLRPVTHVFSTGRKAGQSERRPLGQGVHSAYEDSMVFSQRQAILQALDQTPKVKASERVANGFEAARLVVALMRDTATLLPPKEIVDAFVALGGRDNAATSAALWERFGPRTISVMKKGSHAVGVLWESAWQAGGGDKTMPARPLRLTPEAAMAIVARPDFLPSLTVGEIGAVLAGRPVTP